MTERPRRLNYKKCTQCRKDKQKVHCISLVYCLLFCANEKSSASPWTAYGLGRNAIDVRRRISIVQRVF